MKYEELEKERIRPIIKDRMFEELAESAYQKAQEDTEYKKLKWYQLKAKNKINERIFEELLDAEVEEYFKTKPKGETK